MRKKYNTLNEEMNRMKSLFGESRLYGNLVDKKEEIITEQYGFFRNLDSLFKVSLKSFDDLGTFTKFVNREIKNVDDIIKHFDEFNTLWRVVLPNVKNWTGLENNLKKLKKITDSGNLNTIPKNEWIDDVLPGFPEKGGMRDMVDDMWRKANGKNSLLPQNIGKQEIAVTTKGELVVGTDVNGVIVYKNDAGNIIPSEQIKNIPDVEEVKYFDIDGNEIDVDDVNYKDGETKLYDEFGNEIDIDGKKIEVDEKGTTVYDVNNEEVGVIDQDGNIIDSKGNVVDKNGKIITKAADRIKYTDFTEMSDADIEELMQEKVNSSESGGITVDEVNVPPELSKQYSENQQLLEELRASRKSADEIEQKRLDLEIKKQETEQLRLQKEMAEVEGRRTVVTDKDGQEKIKEKTETELEEKLGVNKFSAWWKKNISKRLENIYLLKVKEGDSKAVKNLKFWGSSMVDPFGLFKQIPEDLSKTQLSKAQVRFFRFLGGNAVNILSWNLIMYHLFGNNNFSMTNIWGTKFEYYKNYSPLGFFIRGYLGTEYDSFCSELKDKTGFCCEKSDDCPDFVGKFVESIPNRMKSKYGNLDCDKLRKLIPDGEHMDDEEKKNFIESEAKRWNKEILDKLDLGFMEYPMKFYGLIDDKMFEVGIDAVDNIKMEDGETSVVDGYFQELTATKCAEDLKPKPFDEDYDEVIVVEGDFKNI